MTYEEQARKELRIWQKKMSRNPSLLDKLSKRMQVKMNSYIPEKVHQAITGAIKQMVRGVLFGATYSTREQKACGSLLDTETLIERRIKFYRTTAAAEGGVTGAGGILLGLADFPILLGIKLKLLFDIAALYGHSIKDYKERLFILHIFQLAFSSQQHRTKVYEQITDWDKKKELLPDDINQFDWREFQQEYRDYIDLAKMAQLIPGIGAVVGIVVNYRLIKKLGHTAMNAYRMRYFKNKLLPVSAS
jgi:hypothetical protein